MASGFEPPGKGSWMMDATHCPKPLVGVLQEVFAPGLGEGMRNSCERYGMLLDTLVVRYVRGFPYIQPKPVGAPEGATGTPPKLLFKLATWFHPQIRRRLRTASRVLQDKPWRAELAGWDRDIKPKSVARHREIDSVDLESLSDADLASHLRQLVDFAKTMVAQDHGYNMTFMFPLGDYLSQVEGWTGANGAELMALLRGHSDASAGNFEEKRRLISALRADGEGRAILESDRDAEGIIDELSRREGDVADALADYLLIVGASLALGLTLCAPTLREQPKILVAGLRASLDERPKPNGVHEEEARIRETVPSEHRAAFDELLADARLVYRLRDERHAYGAIPVCWHARRTLLAIGRRLVASGELPDAELAIFAFSHELADHLRGHGEIDVKALQARRDEYEALDGWKVPAVLGPEPAKPPNDWLPAPARRLADALDAYFKHADAMPEPTAQTAEITGLGVSSGTIDGIARLCETSDDLDRIVKGDILVSQTTTGAINVVLPLLGAIVTDRGGALSHAAIVCREYGIPGVVGTREATKRIRDGDRISVDGTHGTVSIIA